MTEPQISCPNCGHSVHLTESLAAPLIEQTRKRFQEQLASKDAEVARKEEILRKQQSELARARESLEDQIAERLKAERVAIAAAEAKKARADAAGDLDLKAKELAELKAVLEQNNEKLAQAQKAQADLLRKQRELDDAKRELELTIEKRVQDSVAAVHTKARREAEDALNLKIADKDKQISDMTRTVDELRRRVEQGSQQAQGEVLELALEDLLRTKFPQDLIEPVPKGEFGGDLIQRINAVMGNISGTILWEFKRTKLWSDGWLAKLREDQRAAKADIALIISQTLPKNVETFDLIDGVWVANPRCAIPVALALRQSLVELAGARGVQQGQQTKMEQVYQYLTGSRFRQRVEAIIEKFNDMRDDLDREKKFFQKQWAKRDAQLMGVLESTTGLYGDLQGIAGKALPEIGELELPLIEPPKLPASE